MDARMVRGWSSRFDEVARADGAVFRAARSEIAGRRLSSRFAGLRGRKNSWQLSERLGRALDAGLRPGFVLADEVYGNDSKFRRFLENRSQPSKSAEPSSRSPSRKCVACSIGIAGSRMATDPQVPARSARRRGHQAIARRCRRKTRIRKAQP